MASTVTSEAIFIQSIIFTHKNCDVTSCEIPSAFLQAIIPDFLLMRLDSILAELMVKVTPNLYCKYIMANAKGKKILYVQLEKAVYGMMKVLYFLIASLLLTLLLLVLLSNHTILVC